MRVQRELSSKSLATIINSLSEEELKQRVLTESGLTVAEDERINVVADNPETTITLNTPREVKNHFSRFLGSKGDAN